MKQLGIITKSDGSSFSLAEVTSFLGSNPIKELQYYLVDGKARWAKPNPSGLFTSVNNKKYDLVLVGDATNMSVKVGTSTYAFNELNTTLEIQTGSLLTSSLDTNTGKVVLGMTSGNATNGQIVTADGNGGFSFISLSVMNKIPVADINTWITTTYGTSVVNGNSPIAQIGDWIIDTTNTTVYVYTAEPGTANGTISDFTLVEKPDLSASQIRSYFSAINGVNYNSTTGIFNGVVDSTSNPGLTVGVNGFKLDEALLKVIDTKGIMNNGVNYQTTLQLLLDSISTYAKKMFDTSAEHFYLKRGSVIRKFSLDDDFVLSMDDATTHTGDFI